ncbi:hypothetical protein PMZ80_003427 [Knufia obscura]|uniref:Chromosome transmission fidelity protein 8 n=2 Tax=Knufia TaxID=430999 RepID=A0AAN8I9B9_9EURO|nr:hypothetical protein PMZ80_003427 [Knufia obscura]KAK5958654.1 hypothetical protein OHC33_000497 [Knufia fluminis]
MPAAEIIRSTNTYTGKQDNPLPELLHTPAGLAILEIQGTIHAPLPESNNSNATEIGRLEFPLYEGDGRNASEGQWMKKVHLYIGKHQRLSGEVKKLAKPLVVLDKGVGDSNANNDTMNREGAQLKILAIIKHKILFSSRPEPVGM